MLLKYVVDLINRFDGRVDSVLSAMKEPMLLPKISIEVGGCNRAALSSSGASREQPLFSGSGARVKTGHSGVVAMFLAHFCRYGTDVQGRRIFIGMTSVSIMVVQRIMIGQCEYSGSTTKRRFRSTRVSPSAPK